MIVVTVARRPLAASNVATSVLATGTGAVNVDASRVSGPKGDGTWGSSNASVDRDRKFNASPEMGEYRSQQHGAGRWPANVVLEHLPSCVQSGTKQVGSGTFAGAGTVQRTAPKFSPSKGWNSNDLDPSKTNAPNNYGVETVTAWECAPGCPVADLDSESGDLRARGNVSVKDHGSGYAATSYQFGGAESGFAGDRGGASRFFKQVKSCGPA